MLEETCEWLTLHDLERETGYTYNTLKRRARLRGIGRVIPGGGRRICRADVGRLLDVPQASEGTFAKGVEEFRASEVERMRVAQQVVAKWRGVLKAAAQEVHALTGISFETLMCPCREPQIVYARILAVGVLRSYGATVADIGRAMQRTHSTILNLLRRMGEIPEIPQKNRALPEKIRMGIQDKIKIILSRLAPWLEFSPVTNALQVPLSSIGTLIHSRLPEPEASSVTAYINGLLLARTNRNSGPAIANGIWYVAARPDVRHVVISALARTGQSLYEPHLRYHAARYGYPWMEAPTQRGVAS